MMHILLALLLLDIPSAVPSAVSRYQTSIQDLQSRKRGATLQRVYESAVAVRTALGDAELNDGDRAWLHQAVPALDENRAINYAFFADLASKSGNAADAEVVAILAAHPPASCTRFEDLLAEYKRWFAFSRRYNNAWRTQAVEAITRIENDFTTGNCSCDDAETARRALAEAVRDFPNGKITPRLRQRIADIDRGTSDIRFNCAGSTG
jgi:hypothetical protein